MVECSIAYSKATTTFSDAHIDPALLGEGAGNALDSQLSSETPSGAQPHAPSLQPAHFTFDQDGTRVDASGREVDESGSLLHKDTSRGLRRVTFDAETEMQQQVDELSRQGDSQPSPAPSRRATRRSISPQHSTRDDQESLNVYRAGQSRPWAWPRLPKRIIFDVSSEEANRRAQPSTQDTISAYAGHVVRKWATTGVPELAKSEVIFDGKRRKLNGVPGEDSRSLGSRLDALENDVGNLLQERRKRSEEESAYMARLEEMLARKDTTEDELLSALRQPVAALPTSPPAQPASQRHGKPSILSQAGSISVDRQPLASQTDGKPTSPDTEPGDQHDPDQSDVDMVFYSLLSSSLSDPDLRNTVIHAFRGMAPNSTFDFTAPADQDRFLQSPCEYVTEEERQILMATVETSVNKVLGTLLAARVKGVRRVRKGKPPRGWAAIFAAAALVLPKEWVMTGSTNLRIVLAAQESHQNVFSSYPSGRVDPSEVADRLGMVERASQHRSRGAKLLDDLYRVAPVSSKLAIVLPEEDLVASASDTEPLRNGALPMETPSETDLDSFVARRALRTRKAGEIRREAARARYQDAVLKRMERYRYQRQEEDEAADVAAHRAQTARMAEPYRNLPRAPSPAPKTPFRKMTKSTPKLPSPPVRKPVWKPNSHDKPSSISDAVARAAEGLPAPATAAIVVKKKRGRPTNAEIAARNHVGVEPPVKRQRVADDSLDAIVAARVEQRRQTLSGRLPSPGADEPQPSPKKRGKRRP